MATATRTANLRNLWNYRQPLFVPWLRPQQFFLSSKRSMKKSPPEARPSASNEILLLHRVHTSTSFPEAHVFPGGNVDTFQDGELPYEGRERHQDNLIYRHTAIRECFEETGLLLTSPTSQSKGLTTNDLEKLRKQIHSGQTKFTDWALEHGITLDIDGLLPFTRWITPSNMGKRYTTQMYLYFMPTDDNSLSGTPLEVTQRTIPHERRQINPTTDGGVEHTEAVFDTIDVWLQKAKQDEIILFPPQVYLMTLLKDLIPGIKEVPDLSTRQTHAIIQQQRKQAIDFVHRVPTSSPSYQQQHDHHRRHATSQIPWTRKVISPRFLFRGNPPDARSVLALDEPGWELTNAVNPSKGEGENESLQGGDYERVVLANLSSKIPRRVEVADRHEILTKNGRQETTNKI